MSRFGVFHINGIDYDLDDMTIDELEMFEDITGQPVSRDMNYGSAKVLRAVATIFLRRTDPSITAEAIGKVKLIEFMEADEEMPDVGPPDEDEPEENDSELVGSGRQASRGSIDG